MTTQRSVLYISLMFACAMAYALIVYPSLPDRIPIHWNIRGEVDGWGSKNTIFVGPALILFALGLLKALPAMSPEKFKIEPFLPTFNYIMVIVGGLFTFIAWVIVHGAADPRTNVGRIMVTGICLFLAALGNLMGKIRRNFYVGIRTPWTIANDKVWEATHRVGARWMTAGGILAAMLAAIGVPMMIAISLVIITTLYPVIFSYIYYKQLEGSGGL